MKLQNRVDHSEVAKRIHLTLSVDPLLGTPTRGIDSEVSKSEVF